MLGVSELTSFTGRGCPPKVVAPTEALSGAQERFPRSSSSCASVVSAIILFSAVSFVNLVNRKCDLLIILIVFIYFIDWLLVSLNLLSRLCTALEMQTF